MVGALAAMRRVLSPTGTLIVDSRDWEALYRERPAPWPPTGCASAATPSDTTDGGRRAAGRL
ncbi:hypothetical protein SAMN05421869_126139 [Nonomuraea jiangxiensis]|uniref:Uncharacterized protein n=2 Tax=Nonomuraea jiangxiensis TaxID=633440 RepID=A0A1G9KKR1_9ACTN|nr:hypothetical protein SAMN05421869_126139 [Nonomuraea jiangxiensis]